MQEGREVQGKSGTRLKMTLYNYCGDQNLLQKSD